MPRVSVVIPTWNGADLLAHALRSLAAQTFRDFEVIVVDNGSTDGTMELLSREHPDVRVVRFDENRGFAAAVNAGIRASRGEIVVLMNNDTEADPRWLEALVAALDHHPEVASCASKILDFHDRTLVDSAGDRIGIFASQIGHGEPDGPRFAEPRYVLTACGGAAAYRRALFDDVGWFDERFFAYFEDVDFGIRVRFAGHRCLYVPDAVIYHRGSVTARRVSSRTFYLRMRNACFLFFQYMPARRLLWAPLVLAWPFACALIEGAPLRAALRALVDFVRDLPAVLRRRREVRRTRRISWAEFRRELAPPLARQRRSRRHQAAPELRTGRADQRSTPVDVVIVNWNGRRYLPECLKALRRSTFDLRIMVVDNGSRDGSLEDLRSAHSEIEVLALPENAGYGAGANAGLRRTSGPYAMVMNPDVLLAPDHIAYLVSCLDANPTVGAAQGKLYRIASEGFAADAVRPTGVLDSAGHVIRRSRMVVDRGQGREDGPEFAAAASVFSACGAALFLRRAMLEDVAPDGEYFDESFFAYKEDVDLCWRARLLGWDVRYVPDAVGYHVRAWSGRGLPPKDQLSAAARRHSWKNHYLLILKNDRPADLLRALPAVVGWECVRHAYALFRDPTVYTAYLQLVRLLPAALRRRRATMGRRRVIPGELRRWFGGQPHLVHPGLAEAAAAPACDARRAVDRVV